jgi:hypothetical protein
MQSSNIETLDASSSLNASNFIQNYLWRIDAPYAKGWNGSWNDYNHVLTTYTSGKIIQYSTASFFNEYYPHVLSNTTLRATLTVVDNDGLTSTQTSVISSVANSVNSGPGGSGGNTNSECPLPVTSTPVSGNLFWNQCSQDVANLEVNQGFDPIVGMLHDINEPGCTDYVGSNNCDDTFWTTSDNVPNCWTLGDFTYISQMGSCETTNRNYGAFTTPNDDQRYEAYVGSPIVIGNPGDEHTILLPPTGATRIVCTNIPCPGNPFGSPDANGLPYNIQSDAWDGSGMGTPNLNARVDMAAPQAINAWLYGNTGLGTALAKNLVARWNGVGVGQSGGGYSTWQLGHVMFVMRVYGFDVSTSPITLSNGIVTTYSAVFTSMESELWSLLFSGAYLPNTYNASGGLGGHDPENMDAGLLPFSSSVVSHIQSIKGCAATSSCPAP